MKSKFLFIGRLYPRASCTGLDVEFLGLNKHLLFKEDRFAFMFEMEWEDFKEVMDLAFNQISDVVLAQALESDQSLAADVESWIEYERDGRPDMIIGFARSSDERILTITQEQLGRAMRVSILSGRDPALSWAMADFNKALRQTAEPREVVVYAYRAIESVRNWFAPSESDDWEKEAWIRMRKDLGFNEAWLKSTSEISKRARHGYREGAPKTTKQEAEKALTACKEVIDGFIVYLERKHPILGPW